MESILSALPSSESAKKMYKLVIKINKQIIHYTLHIYVLKIYIQNQVCWTVVEEKNCNWV